MDFLLNLFGMLFSVAIIKYREPIGDAIGDPEWMKYVGGAYNFIVIAGVFLFMFCVARMTGTTDLLLSPLRALIPFAGPSNPTPDF